MKDKLLILNEAARLPHDASVKVMTMTSKPEHAIELMEEAIAILDSINLHVAANHLSLAIELTRNLDQEAYEASQKNSFVSERTGPAE
ncbi:MAG: hypothetical protein ABIO85_03090 [Sphingomicrobium sp.]